MHFYWLFSLMIWGSAWCAAFVYPTFTNMEYFTWGFFISVLYYQSVNVIITIPFVIVALFFLHQVIRNLLLHVKYNKLYVSMILPVFVSLAGGVYLVFHVTGLTLILLALYSMVRLAFGSKRTISKTQYQTFK